MNERDLILLEERTNKNTENIDKVFRCIFGRNGDQTNSIEGRITKMRGEIEQMKVNVKWSLWGLGVLITSHIALIALILRAV